MRDLACRTYQLSGGVSVQEILYGVGPSPKGGTDRYLVAVTVLRADGFEVSVQASSYRFDTYDEKCPVAASLVRGGESG